MNWRFIDSGLQSACVNMAIDEAILLAHGEGKVPPTLRIYGWKPAAISLGYFQSSASGVNWEKCRKQGVDVVRRLTGGRAVLHEAEMTYSIIVSEQEHGIPATITASYRFFSTGLLAGLRQLGIEAQMSLPASAYGNTSKKREPHLSAACFDAPSRYEITYEGRKLVGSAQVRKKGVILQHGSLLLRFSPERLAALLTEDLLEEQQILTARLAKSVISLEEILGSLVTYAASRDAILGGLTETLQVSFAPSGLTDYESCLSRELTEEKYSQDWWTRRRE